ncbi:MAG: YibE/F family protein [Syntrophomonadaceae bacterium]|nr:YibE/F family protein [Syntrophomonadaceae bacterium]
MQKRKLLVGILTLLIVLIFSIPTFADMSEGTFKESYEKAVVVEVEDREFQETYDDYSFQEQLVTVKMLTGDNKGDLVTVINTLSGSVGWDLEVKPNDKVVLYIVEENGQVEKYISDMIRTPYLNYLIIFFVLAIVIIGGIKGVKSLVALGLTILAIYKILLPALLKGSSPLLITMFILIGVTLLTMFIIAGFTRKAVAATLGTIGGVIIAGVLALLVGNLAHLTGFASEESRMLLHVEGLTLNIKGLLSAGIIIGALGATMDVAMSIASSISEIKKANPNLKANDLMRAGMNVGRDIMGTMTNTLILAYTGTALPLLILFMAYDTTAIQIFNSELVATEIVRALAGSVGLVFSVPITAFVASFLVSRDHRVNSNLDID